MDTAPQQWLPGDKLSSCVGVAYNPGSCSDTPSSLAQHSPDLVLERQGQPAAPWQPRIGRKKQDSD